LHLITVWQHKSKQLNGIKAKNHLDSNLAVKVNKNLILLGFRKAALLDVQESDTSDVEI